MWPSSSSNGGGETSSSSHYDNRRAQEAEFDAAYETARRAAQAEEREQAGAAAAAAYQADGCTPRRRTHSAASAPEAPSSSSHLPYTQNPGYGATQDVETQSIKLAGSRPLSRASMRFQRPGGHARGNSVYSTTSVAQGNLGYLFLDHPESIAENSGDESPRLMSSPRRGKGVMRPGSRIPSAQGLLDEHLQSPPVPPLPLSAELSGDEERTAVLSPEEAWYTLRALVGAEIETEKGMLWRLRHLDAREDLFGRNGDEDIEEEDIDPRELPILRYLIRHFLLTLPLIRDTIPTDPSNIASETPAFWAEGLHPIILALHESDLSQPEDNGQLSLGSQIFGNYVHKAVERFVSAGLKLSSTYMPQQESTGDLTSSTHLDVANGGFNFQPHLTPPPPGDAFPSPDLSAPNTDTDSPRRSSRRFSLGKIFGGVSSAQDPGPPPKPATPPPLRPPSKSPARQKKVFASPPRGPISIAPKPASSRAALPGPPPVMAPNSRLAPPRANSPLDQTVTPEDFNPYANSPPPTTFPPPPKPAPIAEAVEHARSPSRATGFTSGVDDSSSFVSARESAGMHTTDETTDDEPEPESDTIPHNPQTDPLFMIRQVSTGGETIPAVRNSGWFSDSATPVQEREDPMNHQPYHVGEEDGDTTVHLAPGFHFPPSRPELTASTSTNTFGHASQLLANDAADDPYDEQQRQNDAEHFVAAMALPEALYNSRPVTSAPLAVELVPKSGAPWPFGASVPFWRGVPVEKLKWGGFEADVVGVRNGLFSHSFIIRVRRPSRLDEYVVRSEAQFNKYYKILDKTFPTSHIRRIPTGDLKEDQIVKPRPSLHATPSSASIATARPSARRVNSSSGYTRDTQLRSRASQSRLTAALKEAAEEPNHSSSPHSSKRNSISSAFAKTLRAQSLNGDVKSVRGRRNTISGPPRPYSSMSNRSVGSLTSRLAVPLDFKKLPPYDPRRRALRAWLRDTLSVRLVGHHKETAAFLLLGPIVPRDSDVADIYKREAIDEARRAARVGVAQGAAQRSRTMRAMWSQVETGCIHGDGFVEISNALRDTAVIEQLPSRYYKSIEAMRFSFSQSLFDLLVAGDSSGVIFGKLKKLHSSFPYFLVRQAFRVGRSSKMASYLQDILLSRPFGAKSLLQKILAITLDDDPKVLLEQVSRLRARIGSGTMCEKLDTFVYDVREKKDIIRRYAQDNNVELVLCIVRGSDEPRLPGHELERIARASKRYKAFMKTKPSQLAKSQCDDPDARLVFDLQYYLGLVSRDRDSNIIRSLLGEDDIAHALEVVAGPFVALLKRVYKVGNASTALGQLKTFLDQLIIIVEALRARIQEPQKSVRIIARLLARHQQPLYDFIRNIHRGDPIIEEALQWGWTASVFLRRGLAEPVDLDAIFPQEVEDKAFLFDELEELVAYHRKKRTKVYQNTCRRYAGDVDADDPVIVEGDGHGKSKVEPHLESTPRKPFLQEIPACLEAFQDQLKRVFAV